MQNKYYADRKTDALVNQKGNEKISTLVGILKWFLACENLFFAKKQTYVMVH